MRGRFPPGDGAGDGAGHGTGYVEPLISWRTRARLTLAAMVGAVGLAWHVAVAWTSPAVGVGDPRPTLRAATRFEPLAGLGDGAPGSPGLTVALWVLLLVAELTAYLAWAWLRGSRRARRRRPAGGVPVVRVPDAAPPWQEQPPHPRRHVRRCARSSTAGRRGRRRP